jgi:CHAT domain-containing protein/Flp pilus assembly protein TadD
LSQRYADTFAQLQSGDIDAALQSSEQGFEQTQSDPVWNYKFRVLRAEALVAKGRAADSLDLLKTNPPQELANSEFAVRRHLAQARSLWRLNNFSEAERRIGDAQRIAIAGSPDSLGEVALIHGSCWLAQKDTAKAQPYFIEALTFARQHKQPILEVNAEGSLGVISMGGGRYDEAIDRFKEALASARFLHIQRAEEKTLGNMGESFFELGDFPNASSYSKQAEALAASLGNTDDRWRWLLDLGNQYLSQGNYDAAATAYLHALDLLNSLKNPGDLVIGSCLDNLALSELGRHNLSKAEEYNRRVEEMGGSKQESPLYIPYLLTSAQIAAAKDDRTKAVDLFKLIIANNQSDDSDRWQAQSKLADLYVKLEKTQEADRAFRDAIHEVEIARSVIKQEEKRLSVLDAGAVYDGYVRFLVNQDKEAQAMQIAERSRARTLAEGIGMDAPHFQLDPHHVQGALRQDEIVFAYWLSDQESYLWAITRAQAKVFHLPAQQEINQLIESYNAQVQERRKLEDSPSGTPLYNMLVKPAEALLPQNAHVIVVPHRNLYRLNFETLIVPGNAPHYWIKDVAVENTSSLAFRFTTQKKTTATSKQLLLVGDPVQATPEYPKLKNAANEMHYVAGHFSPGQMASISDESATPDSYFAAQPQNYRYIDFVTHGTAVPLSPLDSAIILSPEKDTSYKLYARDIIKKPIHAEIVTVSACYGAGDRTYSGEGLVGLAWAFMRAGAHHVVAALWEAEDAVTPTLMDDFYTGLKSGKSAADALRDAKLKMLKANDLNARPYYWASLQLYTGS